MSLLVRLILLLTLVPLAELLLLVKLTQVWGSFWITVVVVLGTGILGAGLARHQGLRTLRRFTERIERGELPADELIDGVLILLAAALLVTPGLMTDAVGLAMLVPPLRRLVRRWLKSWTSRKLRIQAELTYRRWGFGPPGEDR